MAKKLTYEYVKMYIENEGYKLLDKDYKNNNTKLLVECPNKHQYLVTFNKFKSGRRCPVCNMEKKKKQLSLNYDQVKTYIESFNYKLISKEYKNAHEKLEIKCDKGHIIKMNFNNFKSGKRCVICDRLSKSLSHDEIYQKIKEEGHELLSEYKNSQQKLKIKCPKGHIYEQSYNYFRNNVRCPICAKEKVNKRKEKRYNEVKDIIEKQNYKLISKEYKNNKEKILIMCPNKHIYSTKFDNFQQGNRCPICSSSKGEKQIINILNQLKILYKRQYKFNDCKFKYKLSFDFYLPNYNCCIEYDGIQHYEIVKYFGGYDDFITRKIKDTIKDIYCKDNDIKLIRIPYWEKDNIKNILIKELNLKNYK